MSRKVKSILKSSPFYTLYQTIRSYLQARGTIHDFWQWSEEDQKRSLFYKQFISHGDLVFDVGANMGNRTKIFLNLQARVVAFEPQKRCYDFLKSVFKKENAVSVIGYALGKEVGNAEMFISNVDTISSLNPAWIESVKRSGRFKQYEWNDIQTVKVTTLDEMIEVFGLPSFIKIDVEGYEYEVVEGLHQQVQCISLEFVPEFIESTLQCIDHLSAISPIELNYSIGESMRLELSQWISPDSMKNLMRDIHKHVFGDIYIRSKNPTPGGSALI